MKHAPSMRTSSRSEKQSHIPGEPGIWLFICGDLILFSLLFILYLKYRAVDPTLYMQSQVHLNQDIGLLNTVLMLSSSWFVVSALQALRRGRPDLAQICLGLAFGCGLGFVGIKYIEYAEKIRHGLTPLTNEFFMYYYTYTGIHLIHVLIGLGVLAFMIVLIRKNRPIKGTIISLECGATFWHLVDLLWIILFALLYLLGAK